MQQIESNKSKDFYGLDDRIDYCLGKSGASQFYDEIIVGRFARISFHRTLRIPEDGRNYPLPAGLGRFPIHRVEDFADKVPMHWLEEGGFFIPMYQKEALFFEFEGREWHPNIVKVCVGGVNAVSGMPYSETLSCQKQDYLVIPEQIWLDGICSGEGLVKQFVAMPLGQGYTIEAQLTDEEKFGGFQIVVMDAISGRFPERDPYIRDPNALYAAPLPSMRCKEMEMGIAAGGSIKQQIKKDTYGIDAWNPKRKRILTIHLVNSLAYKAITGFDAPPSPITPAEYQRSKIPWYSHYDETAPTVKAPSMFKRILGISAIEKMRGTTDPDESCNRFIKIQHLKRVKTPDAREASENLRKQAHESRAKEWWENAIRQISYVIDLETDVRSEDYALRSCCNFHLGRFRDGEIDGSLALRRDKGCIEALTWRAYCRKSLGDHEALREDAERLVGIPETEIIGLELKAEYHLLIEDYCEAYNLAMTLSTKGKDSKRAHEIISIANIKMFGCDFDEDHEWQAKI